MNYENRDTYGIYKSNIHMEHGPKLMGANTLVGNDVYNLEGDDIGEIKEIMLDMATGDTCYAVLSFGSFLGMGEKLFAVPWNALTLDTIKKRFILNVEKSRLQDAPGFNKDHWPNMADQTWAADLHKYYHTKPYASRQHV